jgi:hypothetical protein
MPKRSTLVFSKRTASPPLAKPPHNPPSQSHHLTPPFHKGGQGGFTAPNQISWLMGFGLGIQILL